MTKAKVLKKRVFFPHKLYLDTAAHYCAELEKKEHVSWFDLMACMTTTCLSVEAILNTYGHIVVKEFNDFESSTPTVKIRVICDALDIEFDRSRAPFNEILHLLKMRNKLAHPKYKVLEYESDELSIDDARKIYNQGELLHDIEKTLEPKIVMNSYSSAKQLEKIFRDSVGDDMPRERSEWKLEISENS